MLEILEAAGGLLKGGPSLTELPPRSTGDGVDQFALWVRGDSPVATVRARALDILGAHDLDVYLAVDGKVVEDERQQLAVVAGGGSRITVQPRLRGGALRAALPRPPGTTSSGSGAAAVLVSEPREWLQPFPAMVFQDQLDARLAFQLTALAGATKTYVDHLVEVVTELFSELESVGESLRDDTAALRDQAGRVIQGMQETADQVIHRMTLQQQAAQRKIDHVIVSAERKFSEIDQLVARTWSGVEGVTNFAQQLEAQQAQLARCSQKLEAQQAQLHQQQQHLEQHLHAQQAQTALTQTALACGI